MEPTAALPTRFKMDDDREEVRVAITQMECHPCPYENVRVAEKLVRVAAASGADVVLLQELFANRYFCQEQTERAFIFAKSEEESPLLKTFQRLAKELAVVLPVSFFERSNNSFFNSVVVFDNDGKNLGKYRKSHIPDGPGYQEKFYFSPGDTGFKVFKTKVAKIGVGICWDQWFPEAARAMALQGAELLLYPTAIGSEPQDPELNSRDHWRRVMQGHAAANMVPVIASNRAGREDVPGSHINFYGGSFITDHTGEIVKELDYSEPSSTIRPCYVGVANPQSVGSGGEDVSDKENDDDEWLSFATYSFDLEEIRSQRQGWGLFRDRRPILYKSLLTMDGGVRRTKPFT